MSVSALPEWKQLLLERKRREEEERERREREEEERLASMPAWKRGIIERRRAKQEGGGDRDRERERDGGPSFTDDQMMLKQMDIENGTASETHNQVSVETIGPIRQNPFIRSQNSYKRENRKKEMERESHRREKEKDCFHEKTSGGDAGEREKDMDKEESQGQQRDFWRERDRELRTDRTRDRSEGRERAGTEVIRDRERDAGKGKKEGDRDGTCLPVPGLRTIKAENIIIIERESEKATQIENAERDGERAFEEEEKKGMRMDLREFLTSGGNVTEIRASEVLIIKPSISEEKSGDERKGEGEQGNERKSSKEDVLINEKERTRDGGMGKEKQRDQDGVMKETKSWSRSSMDLHEDLCKEEESSLGSGRVSQILSKFGQRPKPPCRSKSIDGFNKLGKENSRIKINCWTEEERKEDTVGFRGVPKRSFSFSEQVVCMCEEKKVVERTYSDRRLPHPVVVKNEQFESVYTGTRKQERARNEQQMVMQRKKEIETEKEEKKARERVMEREREEEKEGDVKEGGSAEANGGEVFSVASVRNPEGIAFARRISIRQDKRLKEENETEKIMKKERMRGQDVEREKETERQKMHREITEKVRLKEKAESIILRRDGEEVKAVTESVKSLCSYSLDSLHWPSSHTFSDHKAVSQQPTTSCTTKSLPGARLMRDDASADSCRQENQPEQTVLCHHTEELLCKMERVQDISDKRHVEPRRDTDNPGNKEKEREKSWNEQEELRSIANTHIYRSALLKKTDEAELSVMRSPKHTSWVSGAGQQEIHIPRSVFFGVDEKADLSTDDGQIEGDSRRGVERRESWKAGRPLTRVESLRERIRQREMERQRRGEAEGEGERETGRSEGEGMERGEEKRREAEGAQRPAVMNRQEMALPQTHSLFDVTKEVSMSKACPQLPASVPLSLSQSLTAGQEAQKPSSDDQRYSKKHEEFGSQQDPGSLTRAPQEKGETEDDLLEEEYVCPSHSPSPSSSLSPTPSPPLPHSLAAMSRIYNLKTVGSRTAVCISERNSDIPTHSRKVFPEGRFTPLNQASVGPQQDRTTLGSNRVVRDGQPVLNIETSTVQSVQRQVEQLQLREHEARRSSHSDGGMECGAQKETGSNTAQGQKRPDTQTLTQKSPTPAISRTSPSQQDGPRIQSKIPQPKSFTINARNAHSPENIQKPHETPIASSSTSSPSPVSISPSLTPTPSRSSPLFSIRSASGGPGKRGTTITITPRRTAAATSASPAPTGSPLAPETPNPEPSDTAEGRKKRYPTAEEIEVIGGYQNLENSCLVKNRGTPKGVRTENLIYLKKIQMSKFPLSLCNNDK